MMTRKHYKSLAMTLAIFQSKLKRNENPQLAFDALISHLSSALRSDNPNFNDSKFREAIYK